jgi:hypothetical protein
MTKILLALFFMLILNASCSHTTVEDHFQNSMTGSSKLEVSKKFGSPDSTSEDSNFSYYIYRVKSKSSRGSNTPVRLWDVVYKFQYNSLQSVEKKLIPTPQELDKLQD